MSDRLKSQDIDEGQLKDNMYLKGENKFTYINKNEDEDIPLIQNENITLNNEELNEKKVDSI